MPITSLSHTLNVFFIIEVLSAVETKVPNYYNKIKDEVERNALRGRCTNKTIEKDREREREEDI